MAKSTLYKITILNWQKHNPNRKKSYKYTMIANNITSDPKLNSVPTSHRWLYIGIITTCGDHNNETITMTERQVNDLLTTREGAHNALSRLESLQLLTVEKISLFKNRIELNRIEENRREKNRSDEVTKSARASKAGTRGCLPDFDFDPIVKELFDTCTNAAQKAWLEAYPSVDWIVHEAKKANAWMASNPKKRPKDFQKVFNNWLNKGFESYRKSVPSATKTYAEKIQERNDEVRRQLLEEQQ